ncbi:hypothetical protein BD626DRAFT_501815 [Schizophyllum amplum]|uniref:Uncharacterized protein n=1 Tax=Schizophyllum amplum TaxID=97359 RepID=A0A550C8U0_9AGAR|nr:hypothetical protein BD626DRAFT_501815 [Auriculariopsis ampla]
MGTPPRARHTAPSLHNWHRASSTWHRAPSVQCPLPVCGASRHTPLELVSPPLERTARASFRTRLAANR